MQLESSIKLQSPSYLWLKAYLMYNILSFQIFGIFTMLEIRIL